MTPRLIECVPNISEGRDRAKIDAIAAVVGLVVCKSIFEQGWLKILRPPLSIF